MTFPRKATDESERHDGRCAYAYAFAVGCASASACARERVARLSSLLLSWCLRFASSPGKGRVEMSSCSELRVCVYGRVRACACAAHDECVARPSYLLLRCFVFCRDLPQVANGEGRSGEGTVGAGGRRPAQGPRRGIRKQEVVRRKKMTLNPKM